MHYTIYADAFFSINFFIDYMVISLTVTLMGLRERRKNTAKKVLASLVGAGWSVVVIALCRNFILTNYITYFVAGPIMCYIAVGKIKFRRFILAVLCMYTASFLFAGVAFALRNYTGWGYIVFNSNFYIILAIITPVLEGIFETVKCERKNSYIYRVRLVYNGKHGDLEALCDSGNFLSDPLLGGPVNVVNKAAFARIWGEEKIEKYHLIPYNSIGRESGVIPVIQMDEMVITENEKQIIIDKPLIAISMTKFAGGRYDMILNPDSLRDKGEE